MIDTTPSPRALADFAQSAIAFRLLAPRSVIAWADEMIAAHDGPVPEWMIDLSLVDANDAAAVEAALRAVPGDADEQATVALLDGLVALAWKEDRATPRKVCSVGWQIHLRRAQPDELTGWGAGVDDAGTAFDIGMISQARLRQIIGESLAAFAGLDRSLPAWVELADGCVDPPPPALEYATRELPRPSDAPAVAIALAIGAPLGTLIGLNGTGGLVIAPIAGFMLAAACARAAGRRRIAIGLLANAFVAGVAAAAAFLLTRQAEHWSTSVGRFVLLAIPGLLAGRWIDRARRRDASEDAMP